MANFKIILLQFLLNLVVLVTSLPKSTLKTPHNPGNTFSNCIPQRTCATCFFHHLRSGFRTIDGTCNHLRFRTVGSGNTPLKRLLRPDYADGFDKPRGFPGTPPVPTANKVSDELFKVEKQNKGTGQLAVMFMSFGQFLDHDIGLAAHVECDVDNCNAPNAYQYPCFPIPRDQGSEVCTPFARANPVCQNHIKKAKRRPRNQVNVLTAFVDGSQIYGSDFARHQRVRRQDGTGMLKLTQDGLLQFDKTRVPCNILGGCSLVGERRGDENMALNSMHTLWVREHNRIAKELKRINPSWDEELLFQHSRKIIGGILQHITYTEFLPSIVRLPRYKGYNSRLNPTIANAFSAAAFRFGHSLVPNKFSQLNANFDKIFDDVPLQAMFRNRKFINERGIEPTLLGMTGNRSNNIDNGFAFGIVRKLFIRPGKPGHMDLTALNIQRGRDHGIPTYGKWRRACRLPTVSTFEDLKKYMIEGTVDAFRKLYKTPDEIDLFAAGISEKHVRGLQVGPTFECLFRYQFSRLRDADRFFYQSKGVFTTAQFNEIKKSSMARILCNNLKGIVSMQPKALMIESSTNRRIACERIPSLNLKVWNAKLYRFRGYYDRGV